MLIILGQSLFSQESSLIFNKFNLSIFNPAYVGVDGSAININSRAQWLGIEDGPLTNYLIIHFAANLAYEQSYKSAYLVGLVLIGLISYLLIAILIKAFKISDINLKY